MSPALHPGDFLLFERVGAPHRGRIARIQKEKALDGKRIIGLPGERIDIQNERVSINGNVLCRTLRA